MAKTRSPNYPAINLQATIEKAQTLFTHIGRHPAGFDVAVGHLGYSATSSSGRTVMAALRAFGLVEDVEGEKDPLVRLSARGLDIVADFPEGHPGQQEAIQAAALAPKLHQELRSRYGLQLPSDDEIKRFLVRERDFNDNTVAHFIAEYKDSIKYAGLDGPCKSEDDGDDERDKDFRKAPPPKTRERRMLAAGTKEDVFSLDEGAVVLQWPERLSKTSARDLQDWLDLIGRKIQRAASSDDGPTEFTKERAEKSQAIERVKLHFEHDGFLDRNNRIDKIKKLMTTDAINVLASELDSLSDDPKKRSAVLSAIIKGRDAMGDEGLRIYDELT